MQKIFSCFGMLFFALLVVFGLALIGFFYESTGRLTVPQEVWSLPEQVAGLQQEALDLLAEQAEPPKIYVQGEEFDVSAWENPLEALPVVNRTREPLPTLPPTYTPTPIPTATPIPPLEPAVYQTEVILRLKDLVAALEDWLSLNERLGEDWALLDDPAWQSEMADALWKIDTAGEGIANVTPAPTQYAGIQALLERTGAEAQALANQYSRAMQTRASSDFRASGESFERVKAYLAEAVTAMVGAGWTIEP